ncbi:hypothetical protein SAMN02583745_02866 [Thorsellia anophelis DSM 18579]|uniref:DUF2345 domain-containing protein n=1 Tax=Thorsellia anophelis DSM 18579 TaxID=1123402 RepID=A0A1I0FQV1_9GAMM|nr:DUF2345 domain-containing protein [Thorsellia anophelis]SET60765.1 hypothetical protein SAMN02583745_02866 [Thorsellia anophelis DSM 18579]
MGIKIVANQGEISVQAQNDLMELIARKSISITSTEDEIFITAKKKITINANGSYITLDSSKIEHGTTGDFIVKSATFEQIGPASYTPKLPQFPILNEGKHSLRFVFEGANTVVNAMDWLIGTPYKIRGCFGDIKSSGVIDETGKLARAIVDEAEELILTIGKETWDMLDLSSSEGSSEDDMEEDVITQDKGSLEESLESDPYIDKLEPDSYGLSADLIKKIFGTSNGEDE